MSSLDKEIEIKEFYRTFQLIKIVNFKYTQNRKDFEISISYVWFFLCTLLFLLFYILSLLSISSSKCFVYLSFICYLLNTCFEYAFSCRICDLPSDSY